MSAWNPAQDNGFSSTLISDATIALDGTDSVLMNMLASQLNNFNTSGDPLPLPNNVNQGSADPNGAKALATNPGPAFK